MFLSFFQSSLSFFYWRNTVALASVTLSYLSYAWLHWKLALVWWYSSQIDLLLILNKGLVRFNSHFLVICLNNLIVIHIAAFLSVLIFTSQFFLFPFLFILFSAPLIFFQLIFVAVFQHFSVSTFLSQPKIAFVSLFLIIFELVFIYFFFRSLAFISQLFIFTTFLFSFALKFLSASFFVFIFIFQSAFELYF